MNNTNANYIKSIQSQFNNYKRLGDQTIESLSEKELFWAYNTESNSIATIINHLVGNMLSRWTNFYSEDGEKEWRKRDTEFIVIHKSKDELILHWEKGWKCLFNTIDNLTAKDLLKVVKIRNEKHTVIEAVNRQLGHYPYHVGQMIYVAKMIRDKQWKSLSVPRNKSDEYNKTQFLK